MCIIEKEKNRDKKKYRVIRDMRTETEKYCVIRNNHARLIISCASENDLYSSRVACRLRKNDAQRQTHFLDFSLRYFSISGAHFFFSLFFFIFLDIPRRGETD